MEQVSISFRGHKTLIESFSAIFPRGYHINSLGETVAITVITAKGTTMQLVNYGAETPPCYGDSVTLEVCFPYGDEYASIYC